MDELPVKLADLLGVFEHHLGHIGAGLEIASAL
jgi:hypothetical protein